MVQRDKNQMLPDRPIPAMAAKRALTGTKSVPAIIAAPAAVWA
jgi:hypothetical protein